MGLNATYRHEYKYIIDSKQENILRIRSAGCMIEDPHVNDNGTYLVRSLYFDDINDSCLMENIAGTSPRHKYRIRYYNDDTDRITLERKSKIRGMCNKVSCKITKEECMDIINGITPNIREEYSDIKCELLTEVMLKGLKPKVIVSYERRPFVYPAGNVRVTFDGNITSSTQFDRFLCGDYRQRPVLALGQVILEVKWDELIPRHIKDVLLIEKLNWTAFSKYVACRMHNI